MFMEDAVKPMEPGEWLFNAFKQFVFWLIHLGCIAVIWVGASWTAVAVCLALYVVRMFAITGGYHRYFSHHSYKTSRAFQLVLAILGTMAAQKGPLWWASHHRHHHKHSDTPEDIHPPRLYGIWWAHVGWVLSSQFLEPRLDLIKDFTKFPEIRFIDRFHLLPPTVLLVALFGFGWALEAYFPGLQTNATQMVVWGFCVSTTLLYHGTFLVNSAAHLIGKQRFYTGDDSRNSWIVAFFTLGEGWHNNHHRYPGSESQGMFWWEIDISHYTLKVLSWFGIVWDLRSYPKRIYDEAKDNLINGIRQPEAELQSAAN